MTHFNELRLISGDAFTNREFKKSIFEKFGTIPFSSIQVRNIPCADIWEDGASAEETTNQVKEEGSDVSNNPIKISNLLGGDAITEITPRGGWICV